MYSRKLEDGETPTFGVSGRLWNGVLVMFDRGGDSLWTQIEGRALSGEHEGRKLEYRESETVPWSVWRDAHPDTLGLE